MQVANTILAQLGGNRFLAMTGAKNLLGSKDGLSFKVGANAGKVTHVRVTLTPADEYRVEFLAIRGVSAPRTIAAHDGVGCEQLAPVFEAVTGLRTRL